MHAGAVSIQQSKSHVLAGVQDAYWSDEEVVSLCYRCRCRIEVVTISPYVLGGCRVSPLSRGNGYFRHQLQTLPLRLPGKS